MKIITKRFGEVKVPEDKLITMARPILGFEKLSTFCLIETDSLAPFMWLQSVDDPEVSFIVVNPRILYPDYKIEINKAEVAELKATDANTIETYVIVTVPNDISKMTANLQGPILINTETQMAKQLVLVNSKYQVKHYLLDKADLEKVNNTDQTDKTPELVGV